jgi:hypothetical protein
MDCGAERTITLTAPEATYNCDPHAVTVTDDCDIVTSSSAIYTTQDGQTIAGAPTNAGTYTASIAPIYGDDGAEQAISVTYVIDKAAPELIFPPITEGNPGFSGLKSRTTAWFNGQPISGYVKSV